MNKSKSLYMNHTYVSKLWRRRARKPSIVFRSEEHYFEILLVSNPNGHKIYNRYCIGTVRICATARESLRDNYSRDKNTKPMSIVLVKLG